MKAIPIDPTEGLYKSGSDYVHAMAVDGATRLVFVSGTMGLEPDGRGGDTLARQLDLVWSNIRRILSATDMTVDNIVRVTSYLTDPDFADVNAKARVAALSGRVVPTTAIVVGTLKPDWMIEIEVVAAG